MASSRHQLSANAKCRVCNDDASGFHYGVDSCEGCKGFFRRCITQGINFQCTNEEKCQITPYTRNSCQYCRLKKCFEVGMSREASRLGRRPKKVMKTSGISLGLQSDMSLCKPMQMDLKSDLNADSWDYPALAHSALSEMFGGPEMMHKMQSMISQSHMMGGDHTQFNMAHQSGASMPSMMEQQQPQSSISQEDLQVWRQKQLQVMSQYMQTKDTDKDKLAANSIDSSSDVRRDEAASKSSSPGSSLSPCSTVGTEAAHRDTLYDMTDKQKQKLIRYKKYTVEKRSPETAKLIKHIQEEIISSHTTHCYHLRPLINTVSAELDAREALGEDVRPPGGFWSHFITELLPTIERVIKFLKDLPGFREFPLDDEISLIKQGVFSIVLSQAMPMVDPVKFSILDPQLKYRNTRKDFLATPPPFRKLFEDHFVLAREYRALAVTDEETGLINAILGVNSSYENLKNLSAIEKLECVFTQVLYDYVKETQPNDPGRFESIIRLIPMVENASAAHATSIHSVKLSQPTENIFPPLHREIFPAD